MSKYSIRLKNEANLAPSRWQRNASRNVLLQKTTRLDKRITEEASKLDNHITGEISKLDKRITEETLKLDNRITEETSKLKEEINKVDKRIESVKAELIKWMFIFWVGQIGTILAILFAFFKK